MKKVVFLVFILLLFYTRFVGLDWGFPYPMHPDERNMAVAMQSLNCEISNLPPTPRLRRASKFQISIQPLRDCFNPHFFAYGQIPLYLGYVLIKLGHLARFVTALGSEPFHRPIDFTEAVLSLRLISTLASITMVFVLIKIVQLTLPPKKILNLTSLMTNNKLLIAFVIFTFSPYAIQLSHFGTTESLLMLLYSLILYYTAKITINRLIVTKDVILLSLFSGLAIATKVSSVSFMAVPFLVLFYRMWIDKKGGLTSRLLRVALHVSRYTVLTVFFALLFSPHNLISFQDFIGSMRYETDVALGNVRVFYTRQFEYTVPVVFQLARIFPYALGWPQFILGVLGFAFLSWTDKRINILRLALLLFFIPTSFLFAKWTRFVSPVFPIASIFAVLFVLQIMFHDSRFTFHVVRFARFFASLRMTVVGIIFFVTIIPGIAYLSIYQNPDVRFTASEWIYENIPDGSYILSETANVVDIPLSIPDKQLSNETMKQFTVVSFDFYDLDTDLKLQKELETHLDRADYIFVPSRRVFANHVCHRPAQIVISSLSRNPVEIFAQGRDDSVGYIPSRCEKLKDKYPLLNDYYEKLFSGELGFQKVAEFTSFPKIKIPFANYYLPITFIDEQAEETWTVFDHPVVRIFKRSAETI